MKCHIKRIGTAFRWIPTWDWNDVECIFRQNQKCAEQVELEDNYRIQLQRMWRGKKTHRKTVLEIVLQEE